MLEVYVPAPVPGLRKLSLLENPKANDSRLFQHIPVEEFQGILRVVATVHQAAYLLVPHYLPDLSRHAGYLDSVFKEAREARLRPILFTNQDDPSPLSYPEAIIFRPSAYASSLTSNEIILPAQIEDVGIKGTTAFIEGITPIIGFMGKAEFAGTKERVKYLVRNYVLRSGPRREGMYFRRRCLALLARDSRIDVRATFRRSFSANRKSIELPPEEARAAYLESLAQAHYTLAPRGDGNYSLRFYETLASGRTPILVDTDMRLPLEEEISYDDFIIRVPWQKLDKLPELVMQNWNSRTSEERARMQQRAREVFQSHLHLPVFLRRVLTKERLAMVK